MPKISELSAITTLADTDYTVMVDDESTDVTSKVTVATLRTAMHSRTVAIPVVAPAMRPRSSNGCASLAAVSAGSGQPDMVTLDFDASATEYAQFSLPMPSSWNEGTITAKFYWSHAATTTNFGVVWGIQAVAMSNDDTMAVSFGTVQTVTDTGGTTSDIYVTDATSAMTVAGTPAAGDMVCFQVYRDQAAGADNMAIDARLHAVVLFVTFDAASDA
jgi:hypothetical protein